MCVCTEPGSTKLREQFRVTITVEDPDGAVQHDTILQCAQCLSRLQRGLGWARERARATRAEQREAIRVRTVDGNVLETSPEAPARVVPWERRARRSAT